MLIRFYKRRIKKLRKLAAEPDVDLWALDEVHFQQHGSRCRMWVPPEIKDPVLFHEPTRKSVGYFGAVRLRDVYFPALDELCHAVEQQFDSWSKGSNTLKKSDARGERLGS